MTTDAERRAKRRRASAHPDRPGERCSAPRAGDCHACGLCVVACPEQATVLTRPG